MARKTAEETAREQREKEARAAVEEANARAAEERQKKLDAEAKAAEPKKEELQEPRGEVGQQAAEEAFEEVSVPGRLTPREIRERRLADEAEAARLREANPDNLPPGVEPGESLDPKVNPKVGEQDLPVEERTDGRTDGIRNDQMDGVQSAEWPGNDLSKAEAVRRNLRNPPNLDVRREGDEFAARRESPATQREMEAGRKALGRGGHLREEGDRGDRSVDRARERRRAKDAE